MTRYIVPISILISSWASASGSNQVRKDPVLSALKQYVDCQYKWEAAQDVAHPNLKTVETLARKAEIALRDALKAKGLEWGKELFPRTNTAKNTAVWTKLEKYVEDQYGLCFISSFYPWFNMPKKSLSSFLLCKKIKEEIVVVKFGEEFEKLRYIWVKDIQVKTLRGYRFDRGESFGFLPPNVCYVNKGNLDEIKYKETVTEYAMKPFDRKKSATDILKLYRQEGASKSFKMKVLNHFVSLSFHRRAPEAIVKEYHLAAQAWAVAMKRSLSDPDLERLFISRSKPGQPVHLQTDACLDTLADIFLIGRNELNSSYGFTQFLAGRYEPLLSKEPRTKLTSEYLEQCVHWANQYAEWLTRLVYDNPRLMKKITLPKFRKDADVFPWVAMLSDADAKELGRAWHSYVMATLILDSFRGNPKHLEEDKHQVVVKEICCRAQQLSKDIEILVGCCELYNRAGMGPEYLGAFRKIDGKTSVDIQVNARIGALQMYFYVDPKRQDIEKVLDASEKVLKHKDRRMVREAYTLRGNVFYSDKKFGKALAAYESSVKIKPNKLLEKRITELKQLLSKDNQ